MSSSARTGGFARTDRLLDARDFRRVLRQGRRRAARELVVVSMSRRTGASDPTGDPGRERLRSRLGITTGRKSGNAVARNRFKRRIRAWFRARRGELELGTDLVVIARRPGTELAYRDLDARLSELLGLDPPDDA